MKNIIAILTRALAFVFSSRENIAALKQQIADRDQIINDLRETVESDTADDAELEQAAAEAKSAQADAEIALATLTAEIAEVQTAADALAAEITTDASIPIAVADGTVSPQ